MKFFLRLSIFATCSISNRSEQSGDAFVTIVGRLQLNIDILSIGEVSSSALTSLDQTFDICIQTRHVRLSVKPNSDQITVDILIPTVILRLGLRYRRSFKHRKQVVLFFRFFDMDFEVGELILKLKVHSLIVDDIRSDKLLRYDRVFNLRENYSEIDIRIIAYHYDSRRTEILVHT